MTDLAARSGADASPPDHDTAVLSPGSDAPDAPAYEWAQTEPAPKKRRLWLWIGIPVAAVAAGLGAASLVLIAPGTAIAGVAVGGLTPGAAAEAVEQRLADHDARPHRRRRRSTADRRRPGRLGRRASARRCHVRVTPTWNVGAWFATPVEASS